MMIALGTAAAWPLPVQAQQRMPMIGFLHSVSADYMASIGSAFSQGLKETGFVEGQNVRIEYRWAEGHIDRLPALAAELLGGHVAVMFAGGGTEPARAVMAATSTTPIVFVSAADPVQLGLVASLNRPGGNVTGVSLIGSALEAKRLELLHELIPATSTIAVLLDTNYPAVKIQAREVDDAAAHLGVKLIVDAVNSAEDLETAFTSAVQQHAGAMLVGQSPLSGVERDRIVSLAASKSLPAVYWQKEFAAVGGLISYGPNFADGYRQAGVYAGRILNGEKPADLPIVQPTKFELAINLKTARALGLSVPSTLLARADEVIE
jgi:putative ABC transport system substrate-binding protein